MDDDKGNNNPWFRPKKVGFGITPQTWQGWLLVISAVVVEILAVTISHDKEPTWFRAKTSGSGFTPASWQGWAVTVIPIAVFLLTMYSIDSKQRKN